MERSLVLSAVLAAAVLGVTAGVASATPVLDGAVTVSDGYTQVGEVQPYVNGTDATSGTQDVKLYWYNGDATKVYGAIVGDPTKPIAFSPANIYVYSSTSSTNQTTHTAGTYGDGDDLIIEGTHYEFSLDGSVTGIWASPSVPLTDNGGGSYTSPLVSIDFNPATLTEEFSIDRSLLGNYDQYRFGGQLFAYEFNTGGDRQDGPLVPAAAPEPTSLGIMALGAVALIRRRRTAK